MPVTDSVIPMASQLELEPDLASVPAWVSESVWARESGLPTVPAWVPESASGRESVWVPESALGLAPGLEPDLASVPESAPELLARASELESRSDSGWEPESAFGSVMPMASQALESASDSEMPVLLARESASVWVPVPESDSDLVLASVMPMALQASDSAWVPESVWARESASELGEDRNQRHLQPLSLPLLRLLPRIYPGK